MQLKYPAFYEKFRCPCGAPFEPMIVNLSAEIITYNKDLKGRERTGKYRYIAAVVCGGCDTVIGVLPEVPENQG